MNTEKLDKLDKIQKRKHNRERIDRALASGALTMDMALALSPSDTSPEHHQTVIRRLSSKGLDSYISI